MAPRKSDPVTAKELASVIREVRDAARKGAEIANRPASSNLTLEREPIFELLNAQRDLQDLLHKVMTIDSQNADRMALKAQLRAEIEGKK